jgi:hypothetical protein
MAVRRRDLLRSLLALGGGGSLASSPAFGAGLFSLLGGAAGPQAAAAAQAANPDFDQQSFDFWSGFLDHSASPVVVGQAQSRGKGAITSGDSEPVFLHYATNAGFSNAAELDSANLVAAGDVMVSVNTSAIKVAERDQATFDRLQNAQLRVDVAQKKSMLPVIEAMAYTAVSGMLPSGQKKSSGSSSKSSSKGSNSTAKSSSSGKSGGGGSVQSAAIDSDPTWQKMQSIILPGGEGRWALNLEAQKKDSLFYKVMELLVKNSGQFFPMIGLPGIAVSALQSFNVLYGAIHSEPVSIIKSPPIRVFATQDALQSTGAPGAANGILLQSGTYILMPANQAPDSSDLKKLKVLQGRIVPQDTTADKVDAAALDTLPDVTYVTFDVQVKTTRILSGSSNEKAG